MNRLFSGVKRCSQGDVKLWKVFWLLNIVPFIVLLFLSIILAHYLKVAAKTTPLSLSYAVHSLSTCYFAWVAFCIWRCSDNVNWQGWGIIVRLYEIIICYLYAAMILNFEIATVKSMIGPSFYTHAVTAILITAQILLLIFYIAGIFLKINHSSIRAYRTIHGTVLPWLVAILHLGFLSSPVSSNMLLDHGYSGTQIAQQIFKTRTNMTQQQIDQIVQSGPKKPLNHSTHSQESILTYQPSTEPDKNATIDN